MAPPSFPDETPVEVRFPLTKTQERGDRELWPWLPATVLEQVGPDEWAVCIDLDELDYPVCFRDSSELRTQA